MTFEYRFAFPLPQGLHARPASALRAAFLRLVAEPRPDVVLLNERNANQASLGSVLSLVATDTRAGDSCQLRSEAPEAALAALRRYLEQEFPHCDEPAPEAQVGGCSTLPRPVQAESKVLRGRSAHPGLAVASVCRMSGGNVALPEVFGSPEEEGRKLASALADVRAGIGQQWLRANAVARGILQAHLDMLEDEAFLARMHTSIHGHGRCAGEAILEALEHFSASLRQSNSEYLQARVLDLRDLSAQLLKRLYGEGAEAEAFTLSGPSVLVAESLTPSQFLALDRVHLKGLVLAQGGLTSHTVILARSHDIPTLVDVQDSIALAEGDSVVLDATRGLVIPQPSRDTLRYYRLEQESLELSRRESRQSAQREARSLDGQRLEVAVNVATAAEVASAVALGAEGVGLFRTEMLFMDREAAPSEDEQTEVYAQAARAAQGRPVIIRMLDIGGDKPLPYLALPPEENPFLGWRAVRLYPAFEALARTQIRAVLRSAREGQVRLMVPMVCCLEELRYVKRLVAEEAADLQVAPVSVGMMLEVPSAALILDQLCREADFFSLGTNDLAQYFLAVDRGNPKVAELYSPLHPAFLRFLERIVTEIHRHGRWVGLCGEMGGQLRMLPLLLGLGLDEVSVSAPSIPALKQRLATLDGSRCRALLDAALSLESLEVVETLLASQAQAELQSLLDPRLMRLDSDSENKDEVIKELVESLRRAGRTDRVDELEEALWAREAVYSTGIGFGFAIPHCKSEAIASSSIALARLREPVAWQSLDGQPVRCVIMLCLRPDAQGSEHMKILAKLARKIMHEDFRQRLMEAEDPAALEQFLRETLEIEPHR